MPLTDVVSLYQLEMFHNGKMFFALINNMHSEIKLPGASISKAFKMLLPKRLEQSAV